MFLFSDIHHPVICFYMHMLMYFIFLVSGYTDCLNKGKLIYLYNNMDYDAVSMKTAIVLIVEVFCSAPLDRVL